ncbi:MAG: DNA internalization-related competence protein ComEC/Rec2 [Armatimonadota bacterium]|nr:DNA internalization-related competence protein ComEC/Rec2 [Armatimonadota bacterium]MDR7451239.1 DNA internalization-related competence protein ComEC/Rec2 [Armatimonadota bacterium]MDR7466858.1 DNA internalization-related competence protein ComEC/Rec2 [Armatimonadota bacterium]MDR7492669.1 DNA internalization-related competence protein ComEC/Rec2 [Armatimonadota bacterium]MDR7499598.1 DNA internalization-related competence protein ComEC/Rec2 [Armatimonadota bacterium]
MFRPIVWMAWALAAGIAVAPAAGLTIEAWVILAAVAAAAAAVLLVRRRPAAVPLLAVVGCLGAVLYLRDARPLPSDPFVELEGRGVVLTGVVAQPLQRRRGRTHVVLASREIRTEAGVRRIAGRVLVSVRGTSDLRYGDVVRARGRLLRPPPPGNPGEPSYRSLLIARGIRSMLVQRRGDPVEVVARGRSSPLLAGIYGLRERVAAAFSVGLPGLRGALLTSLLLGDDGALPEEVTEAFRRAGLLHILVVSGAQVGLVMAVLVWIARLLRAPPLLASVASALGVVVFALMAGWAPSVARAALMGVTAAAALAGARVYDVFAALAFAALALLATSPLLLFDPGFQLSFVATWALVYVAPAVGLTARGLPRAAARLIEMTVAAQVAVLPVLAYHFQQLPLAGFVANLAVVPIVAVLVPAGFAAAAVGAAVPSLAAIGAQPLAPLLDAVLFLARTFAGWPGAAVPVFPPTLAAIAGFYLGLVGVVEWRRGRLAVRRPMALAVLLGVVALSLWARALPTGDRLQVAVLDVGQGDAILLRGPSGRTVLIDGGGEVEGHPTGYDVGARRVVPALRRLGVRAIDVVVLSHPHEDHVGGLVAVLQNFRVGLVLDSGLPHPAPSYARLLELVRSRRIPYRLARRGLRLDLGDGVLLAVLLPQDPLIVGSGADPNLNSVVLRLTYRRVAALFTGDMEALNELELLDRGDELRSAILKVAHHGSDTSTTEAFVDAVRPALALISVGVVNPFGHPHRRTLETLEEWGAQIFRTDRDGAILIQTDGARVAVRAVRR